MARANGAPSKIAVVGMLCGMLLLALAGTLVIFTPTSMTTSARRLNGAVQGSYGYVTTTKYPSSLDSSDSSSSSDSLEPFKSSEGSSGGSLRSSGTGVEGLGSMWGAGGTTTFGQLLAMLCFAAIYNSKAVEPALKKRGTLKDKMKDKDHSGHDDFENGICQCFDDKWVCIHGFCCPLVRVAHTNAVAGVCGFWETAVCYFCCAFFSVNLGPCCLMVYWRMKLKEVMKIDDHVLNDFCVTLFCPWLSICQQGTAVDTEMGYEVTGCCDLKFDHDHHHAGTPLK